MLFVSSRPRGALLLFALAIAFIATVIGVGRPAPAAALTNCTVTASAIALDSEETAFLALINQYRAQNGKGALVTSLNLNRTAAWHGNDMGVKKYFSHTDSLGRSPSTRAQNCDYPGGAGENIAAGTVWDTAQEAFTAWKNSAGHNANMLNSSYKYIGIARAFTSGSPYGWYWVTDFGLVNDGTSGGGGGGGGGAATPTPTSTPASSTSKAAITSPAAGSTLAGSSATFSWSAGSGALEYFLYAGTSAGANNIYGASAGTNRSATVGNLPTNGSTVYVRLYTRSSAGWQYNDYNYRAATVATGGGGSTATAKAAMTSPAPGSRLPSTTTTFQWSAGTGAQQYWLYVGTTAGASNLYNQGAVLNRSATVSGLPRGTSIVYVRLWTLLAGTWQYNDYTFTAAP